ncbi:heme biosynthesis HemY N-terminal domain-containing protein [Testudinibacter sp. TR-2022]|uniref:heme biosynthesis HemY N-terminal domain-containing protein n=1 Tax=Testudinibacter sp. TR-2022 TaxID=2585029 RepID=UPI00111BAE4A|nr:heme biosynthesis HemY N-terminal domain-containing protein [Testudinibacter sp. TR-2022]TNH05115.1 heme biosynthesis protein HemY [Pasteurellaceae bacterium Phil11]TNH24426.1 heme biosynthesis protein HemY [Testudinibacter sp. TR-2022]TNH26658.1 heme biosynthesis protein HemY [Testudinibacter sp. TR-2022]
MFKILFLMLILLAGLIAGPYLSGKQGYVLISTSSHNIEMTIPTLVIFFVLALAAVYTVETVISRFCRLNKSTYGWFSRRKRLKAEKQTLAGLIKMDEGDYAKAEKLIGKNAKHASEPVLNFIKAAEAAQQKGDEFSANKYLIEATKLAGNDNLVVELARTRILLQQSKLSAARSSIDSLLLIAPYNPEVLRLAVDIYLQSKAYTSLDELFGRVENKLNYSPEKLSQLRHQIEDGLQDEKLNEDGVDGLLAWWEAQPRKRHNDIYAKIGMVKRLIAANDHDSAYDIALETIKKVDKKADRLALLQQLPHLQLENDSKLIKILEKQLRNENDSELKVAYNRALGYLDVRLGEFESAKTYLNNVLSEPHLLKSSDFTMAAYTYEQLKDPASAEKVRKQGLQYVMKSQQGKTEPATTTTSVAVPNNKQK